MKKLISLLLVLATVLSCFMLTVSADDMIVSDEGRLPFEDVRSNHWFYDQLTFCYVNGIINGMNEYTFGWNGNLTRAQFLTMLATIDGADLTQYSVTKFEDVKSTHWYYGAVAWAYETKLTEGLTETKFGPNQAITRAQIARFMWIYMKDKYTVEVDENCLEQFVDVYKVPSWAQDGMKYAVSAGLISGMQKNDKLWVAPNDMTTRAQTAVIFKNATEQYFCGECEHNFSEADCTNAAACEKCGLVNGLPNGHSLAAYDCVTGGKCFICDAEVEPSKTLHVYAKATCTEPATCTRCGATRGKANGHKWEEATCYYPKGCIVCKLQVGSPLPHTTANGNCTRCGSLNFTSDFNMVVYFMKCYGLYDGPSNTYYRTFEHYESITVMSYHPSLNMITITNNYYFENGGYETVQIQIREGTTVYEYYYVHNDGQRDVFYGYGLIDAPTYTQTTKEGFSDYEGTYKSYYTDNLNEALNEMMWDAHKTMAGYFCTSLVELGFKSFITY